LDKKVYAQSFPEIMKNGNWVQKIGVALSVALGGISQVLTGDTANPVLDMLNKEADRVAADKKLDNEQKTSLRKQLYENGMLAVDKYAKQTDNLYKRAQIQDIGMGIKLKSQQLELAQQQQAQIKQLSQNSGQLSPYELHKKMLEVKGDQEGLKELDKHTVYLPNGQPVEAKGNAEKIPEFNAMVAKSKSGIENINEIVQLVRAHPLEARTEKSPIHERIKSKLAVLTGQAIPLITPGVIREFESGIVKDITGDPTKVFQLQSAALAKMEETAHLLNATMKSNATQFGIKGWPTYTGETQLQQQAAQDPRLRGQDPELIKRAVAREQSRRQAK
jgi:hypothetical protein